MTETTKRIGCHHKYGSASSRGTVTRMIRHAKKHGAKYAEVWGGGDEADYLGEKEFDILDHCFACDFTALLFFDKAGNRLGKFLLVPANEPQDGNEIVGDWSVNSWTDELMEAVER